MSNRPYDAEYEPRPRDQAFDDAQRYQQFLGALMRAGLGNRERAEACAVAVLCSLERRIGGPEARQLNQQLPWALRDLLRRCELHPRARPERFGREDLLARVAEELDVDAAEATRVTRAVLSAAQSLLSDEEATSVRAQLPPEMKTLWTGE